MVNNDGAMRGCSCGSPRIRRCEVGEEAKCIVRLRTTAWDDGKGLHVKKSLTYLRRKCVGHNVLEHDVECCGAEDIVPHIKNLCTAEDGVYEAVPCDIHTDWETGIVDGYSYKLVPVKEV